MTTSSRRVLTAGADAARYPRVLPPAPGHTRRRVLSVALTGPETAAFERARRRLARECAAAGQPSPGVSDVLRGLIGGFIERDSEGEPLRGVLRDIVLAED